MFKKKENKIKESFWGLWPEMRSSTYWDGVICLNMLLTARTIAILDMAKLLDTQQWD